MAEPAVTEPKDVIAWQPHRVQWDALKCPAFELFFGGSRFGGKSDWLLMDFYNGIKYGENYKGILFRKSYPEFEELLFRSKQLYPTIGGSYAVTARTWSFKSGASLKMRYLEADADVEQYQGHSYPWIGFDELPNWSTDYCYRFMFSCARSAHGIPVRIRSTGNPGSVGQAWVKARFVDVIEPRQIYHDPDTGLSRCFIPSRLEDNPFTANDPQYEQRLKTLPGHLYRAHRFGDWTVFAGQAFDFNETTHVIDPVRIPEGAPVYMGFDWGFGKPFAVTWCWSDADGRLYLFDEWYGWNGNPNEGMRIIDSEIAAGILEHEKNNGIDHKRVIRYLSHDCFNKKPNYLGGGQGKTTAEVFAEHGVYGNPANPARNLKIRQFRERLAVTKEGEMPMFVVYRHCKHFIRTVPSLVVDKNKPEDIDTDGDDHLYDSVCNIFMSHPMAFKPTEKLLPSHEQRLRRLEQKRGDPFVQRFQVHSTKTLEVLFGAHRDRNKPTGRTKPTIE